MGSQAFLRGAAILTAAGLISKLLGALYRIPLARMVGAEGIGLYQMAYPFYTAVLAISTAGIPVALSILVAEQVAHGNQAGARRILRVALTLLLGLGLVGMAVFLLVADFVAIRILHEPRAAYSLVSIAPAILFAGGMAAWRGYFQGLQQMVPTAASQVIEQLVRVATIFGAVFYLYPFGIEFAAAGATFGATTGGLAGIFFLFLYYRYTCRDKLMIPLEGQMPPVWTTVKKILSLALPVSLGGIVLPLTQVIDAVVVPARLQAAGYSVHTATELFGQLTGMAITLVNLPAIITVALGASLVPAVAERVAARGRFAVGQQADLALRTVLLLALPAATGLYLLAIPICELLFGVPQAGASLAVLAPAVVFLGLYQATAACLQGLGRTAVPVVNFTLATGLKVGLSYYLTGLPALGIRGAALATVISFAAAAGLNLWSLSRAAGYRPVWWRLLPKPLGAVTMMALSLRFGYPILVQTTGSWELATLLAVIMGAVVYLLSLLAGGGITRQELRLIFRHFN